ncbi:hypothetical protein L1887_18470 [Cichorium endivia]|nr:hypothetical protein L1887_18470 [Cichorium endivia]
MALPSIHPSHRPLIGVMAVMSSLHITIKPRKATTNRLTSLSENPPSPLLLLDRFEPEFGYLDLLKSFGISSDF